VKSPRDAEDPPVDNKDKVTAQVLTKVLPRTGSSGTGTTMKWAGILAAFGIALVIADRRRTRTTR
jgi:LPXTG-motif cell wall-anchored protein